MSQIQFPSTLAHDFHLMVQENRSSPKWLALQPAEKKEGPRGQEHMPGDQKVVKKQQQ